MLTDDGSREGTAVILPCLRGLRAARRSLIPLLQHTPRSVRIVLVTNTRTGPLASYLAGVRDTFPSRFVIVVVPGLKRVRSAWRRGLRKTQGEYVALLKPGTIVTDDWLKQLMALAQADPSIGMVAPMSNGASSPQAADGLPTADQVDVFASRWRSARLGRWLTTDTLSGPCLLVKRAVLETVAAGSPLRSADLRPDRLSSRIRQRGFQLAIANDLYVHQLKRSSPPDPQGGDAVEARPCRVSLTMIVRNEEANLPDCLASAAGLFDEVVIVDTGSTDRTVEIARSHGARVFDFPWVDDFAAARNAALARVTGDYAFWLDADDRIEPPNHERLRLLFDGLRSKQTAFVVRCSCDADSSGGGATVVDHVRLFPLREDIRWTYRVHEQILPAIRRAGVAVDWTDVTIRHVGYNDPILRRKKLERDKRILSQALAEMPDEPFVLFNLGQITLEAGDAVLAVDYLKRSLARSSPGDSITCKLHTLLARAYQQVGDLDSAVAVCEVGLKSTPDDAELLFRKGIAHRLRGEPDRASACWNQLLGLRRPERFASVDEGIFGHVTHRNLAMLCEELGDRATAASHWSAVLVERPADEMARQALNRLGHPLVRTGDRTS